MHTPGPWQLAINDPTLVLTEAVDAKGDAFMIADGLCSEGCAAEEHFANCRLIAAAPELLAACKAYSDYCDPTTIGEPVLIRIREQIRAAITKATGAA